MAPEAASGGGPRGERRALLWVSLLLLSAPAIDTLVAFARGWSPNPGLRIVGQATVAVAALAWVAAWPMRRVLASPRWFIPLVTATVTLLTVETVLRATPALRAQPYEHTRGPGIHREFEPNPRYLPGIEGRSTYTTNRLGYRGPDPDPSALNILAIGASTTEGTYLDDQENWPAALQRLLASRSPQQRVVVDAAGISGYTTIEHLDYLERSEVPWRFDVLIFTIGVNDMLKGAAGDLELGRGPIWRSSVLVRRILAVNRFRLARTRVWLEEDREGANMEDRRQARRLAPTISVAPEDRRAVEDFARRVARLARACQQRGRRCLFVTQPTAWGNPAATETFWMGRRRDGFYYQPTTLRTLLHNYDEVMRQSVGDDRYASLHDLDDQAGLFVDDCHVSEAGARAIADRVASALGVPASGN
jgi:lysophospholipase L1-like esterase